MNPKLKYYKILGKLKGFPRPNNFPGKIVLAQRKSQLPNLKKIMGSIGILDLGFSW